MVKIKPHPATSGNASADRLLTLLTAFRIGDKSLTLAELAERTELNKATIMRLIVSLEDFGFVNRLSDGRYTLASEVMRLNTIYQDALDLERHVMPCLQQLVDEIGETASFYVKHGAYRLCQYRINSTHRLRVHVQPGEVRPMDGAACAQALKSTYKQVLARTEPFYSTGVTEPHAAGMALPVFDAQNEVVGALLISGPSSRFTAEVAKSVGDFFFKIADDLTKSLGGKSIRN
ncbi:IclR family transcriptional regulator [Acinetobacter baumannii]|uniref:Transcriptional regulatory protein n=1 Tax=Acinetobacter baumannii TaxID=470 RepID=A0A335GIP5_ACIBA|nr:helix-turn-helix domain-containing protein [Acinetobacter baumannii]MCT9262551.1 helix-turn-helix domain-containing protein [Acinetobacter baumannii]WNX65100.1 helix-turn-helix domain-containing protein [Acinetobacter baumannii]SSO87768.1 transcriptional regulatory protein [Acinetobacter baumannii]SST32634.1 transcriptional regulatory protein [Acinetobacter baumannii]HAV4864955.1 helix-turn-helix domain-containing protein [Acinetobacter baumannii]